MSISDMVEWPAVIRYCGDDELTYVGSVAEWKRDAESHLYTHQDGNQLIDSNGFVYNIVSSPWHGFDYEASDERVTLEDFIRLVRIHASSAHRCCIEKIRFRSIAEGIELVAGMDDGGT